MKRNRRILSALLAVLMLFSLAAVDAFASEEALAEEQQEELCTDCEDTAVSEENAEPEELTEADEADAAEENENDAETTEEFAELTEEDGLVPEADEGWETLGGTVGPIYILEPELSASEENFKLRPLLRAAGSSEALKDAPATRDEAIAHLSDRMAARDTDISVTYQYIWDGTGTLDSSVRQEVHDLVTAAWEHDPDRPTAGDYSHYNTYKYRCSIVVSGRQGSNEKIVEFNYTFEYLASAEQEAVVDEKVAEILASLELDGKTDLEKVTAIYDWLCENVVYSNPIETISHSSYAAIVSHDAVCQGYATAFYRLCLETGVDARYISGVASDHAWDIVQINGCYYYVDATWDADPIPAHDFFLRGSENWTKGYYAHELGDQFDDPAFAEAYPVSVSDYAAPIVAQGSCGTKSSSITWAYSEENKTLTLTGTGKMLDYSFVSSAPWRDYAAEITTVVIGEGITHIGKNAFAGCAALDKLYLPVSLSSIGSSAVTAVNNVYFSGCSGLWNKITGLSGNPALTGAQLSAQKHIYDEEVVPPTCTEDGYTLHTCVCGDSYADNEVTAPGHSYTGTQVVPPTCTEEGYTIHSCFCGDYYVDSYTDPTGHSFTGDNSKCDNCNFFRASLSGFNAYSSTIEVGRTYAFQPFVNHQPAASYVAWSASNGNVKIKTASRISAEVTGVKEGSVVITATLMNEDGTVNSDGGNVTASITVNVKKANIIQTILDLLNPINIIKKILSIFK